MLAKIKDQWLSSVDEIMISIRQGSPSLCDLCRAVLFLLTVVVDLLNEKDHTTFLISFSGESLL